MYAGSRKLARAMKNTPHAPEVLPLALTWSANPNVYSDTMREMAVARIASIAWVYLLLESCSTFTSNGHCVRLTIEDRDFVIPCAQNERP